MVKTLPSNAGDAGLTHGQGANIPHDETYENIKQKQYCNKFNTDSKKWSTLKKKKKRKT